MMPIPETDLMFSSEGPVSRAFVPWGQYLVKTWIETLHCDTPHPNDEGHGVLTGVVKTTFNDHQLYIGFDIEDAFTAAVNHYEMRKRRLTERHPN